MLSTKKGEYKVFLLFCRGLVYSFSAQKAKYSFKSVLLSLALKIGFYDIF